MSGGSLLNALGHASSGSAGTAISTAALYPLDLITTRLKTQRQLGAKEQQYDNILDAFREIVRHEGTSSLYSGLGTDIGKSVVDSFLFFGFYNYLSGYTKQPTRVLQELVLGAAAGAAAKAVTTPISNVIVRKQTSTDDQSLVRMLREMYQESGFLGLWAGYSATLVLTLNPSITFFANKRLAKKVIPALEEGDVPVAWAAFLIAAFSKATATAATYPFQTGKTRLQVAPVSKPDEEQNATARTENDQSSSSLLRKLVRFLEGTIFGVVVGIVRREGVTALYDGLSGELLKSFFSHGLTMFSKGVLHRLIVRLWLAYSPQLRQRLGKK